MSKALETTKNTSHARVRSALRLLGPLLLLVFLAAKASTLSEILALFRRAWIPGLAFAMLLNALSIHAKVVRWQVLLRVRHIHYSTKQAWKSFVGSMYIGLLTPGRVGDLVRAQYLHGDKNTPYVEGIASIVMDRICDLYVLGVFVAFGMVRYRTILPANLTWIAWATIALTLLGPGLLFFPRVSDPLFAIAFRKFGKGFMTSLEPFTEALRAQIGWSLIPTMALTVFAFAVNYAQGYLIAYSIAVHLSVFDILSIMAIASLLGLLPISLSGLGVRELFFSIVFPYLGYASEVGIGFGLLVFAILYLGLAFIGFVGWQMAPPPIVKKAPTVHK